MSEVHVIDASHCVVKSNKMYDVETGRESEYYGHLIDIIGHPQIKASDCDPDNIVQTLQTNEGEMWVELRSAHGNIFVDKFLMNRMRPDEYGFSAKCLRISTLRKDSTMPDYINRLNEFVEMHKSVTINMENGKFRTLSKNEKRIIKMKIMSTKNA